MDRIKKVTKLTENPFLNLFELDARKPNGKAFKYYLASRGDGEDMKIYTHRDDPEGVVIYGVTGEKNDHIVLVRQYRYPINGYIYEFPAGLVDGNEDPQMTGVREFKEETGMDFALYTGGNGYWRKPFYTTVGLTDESVEPVYGFASGRPSRDFMEESEDIETVIADKEEVRRILREERVAMKCALLLMQFLASDPGQPFAFLDR